jgi:hypothetical protein
VEEIASVGDRKGIGTRGEERDSVVESRATSRRYIEEML